MFASDKKESEGWQDKYSCTWVTVHRKETGFGYKSGSIETLNKKCKNIILNTIYRPPNGDIETC